MALIKCPECGKEISDKATSCPNCGVPIKPQYEQSIVICPKCMSEQLEVVSMSDGFSKTKAAAGGLLLGGVGLLAGLAGSDKIKLYCKSCGHTFLHSEAMRKISSKDEDMVKEVLKKEGLIAAVSKYKELTGCNLSTAKEYIDRINTSEGVKQENNSGCLSIVIVVLGISTLLAIM